MYANRRIPKSLATLLFFLLATLLLAACSGVISNQNWPGLSANGQTVYVAYGQGVVAIDVNSGQELWRFPAEAQARLSFYAAPSVRDGRVVVGDFGVSGGFFSPGVVVSVTALDDNAGTLWTNNTFSDRILASPLQADDHVYVATNDNFLLSLDPDSGEEQWRFEAGNSIYATPAVDGKVLYLASLDKNVYALDADTGEVLWQTTFDGSIANAPAINGEQIYVSTFDSKVHAVDKNKGFEKWAVDTEGWMWAGPAVAGGVVYFGDLDGNIYAMDAGSGTERWSKRDTGLGLIQGTAIVQGDTVYFVAADKEASGDQAPGGTVLALSSEDGTEKWRQSTPGRIFTTPVVADNTLVVVLATPEAPLYRFDLQTGEQQGTPLVLNAPSG